MEPKTRSRTVSLNSPRMAPKLDKKWQSQLESMEKRLTENIDNVDKRITESLIQSNKNFMGEIKTLVVNELKGVRKDLGEIKSDVQRVENKVQETEMKVQELEKQVMLAKEENKNLGLKYELKVRESGKCGRGII